MQASLTVFFLLFKHIYIYIRKPKLIFMFPKTLQDQVDMPRINKLGIKKKLNILFTHFLRVQNEA